MKENLAEYAGQNRVILTLNIPRELYADILLACHQDKRELPAYLVRALTERVEFDLDVVKNPEADL